MTGGAVPMRPLRGGQLQGALHRRLEPFPATRGKTGRQERHNRLLLGRGIGQRDERLMSQDEIGRLVGSDRLVVTPVPELPQDGQTAPVEFIRAFDAPDLVGIRRSQFCALVHQPRAAFFLPGEAALFLQSGLEQVGQRFEVAGVVARVVDHSFGQWSARPVGLLRPLLQMNAQQLFHEIGQSEFNESEQSRGQHRVKNGFGHEVIGPSQQTQVVVGAVQNQFLPAQGLQQWREVHRRQRVNQHIGARQADLHETELFRVGVQTVGLGVQRQPVGRANARHPIGQLFIALNHPQSKAPAPRKTEVDCEKSARIITKT